MCPKLDGRTLTFSATDQIREQFCLWAPNRIASWIIITWHMTCYESNHCTAKQKCQLNQLLTQSLCITCWIFISTFFKSIFPITETPFLKIRISHRKNDMDRKILTSQIRISLTVSKLPVELWFQQEFCWIFINRKLKIHTLFNAINYRFLDQFSSFLDTSPFASKCRGRFTTSENTADIRKWRISPRIIYISFHGILAEFAFLILRKNSLFYFILQTISWNS